MPVGGPEGEPALEDGRDEDSEESSSEELESESPSSPCPPVPMNINDKIWVTL